MPPPVCSTSYDEIPYSSFPYAKSHPRHLAALGRLFGMSPPQIDRCRVLEIGCASGGNLIPIAERYPESTCVGIDASANQINDGQSLADRLDLNNLTLRAEDVLEFSGKQGPFDYIICHGVFSWVAEPFRQKILQICRDQLSPQGIAYISYNTYPGWYLRRGVREMMTYHAQAFDETQSRIDQARALLSFLNQATESNADAYERLLSEELTVLQSCEDSYLYHEHLESINEPFFFHQFASLAEQHELRFLSEAHFQGMIPSEFPDHIRATLAEIAPGIVQMEQYMDFLRNRKFRQTLLCHHDVHLDRAIDPSRLVELSVASAINETDVPAEEAESIVARFEHRSGQSIKVTQSNTVSTLRRLAEIWPAETSIKALAELAWHETPGHERSTPKAMQRDLCQTLLECYTSGLIDLFADTSRATCRIDSHPRSSPLARIQAGDGKHATNERHETVRLDDFERKVVCQMDGTQTLDEISAAVDPDSEAINRRVREAVDRFARTALLIEGP